MKLISAALALPFFIWSQGFQENPPRGLTILVEEGKNYSSSLLLHLLHCSMFDPLSNTDYPIDITIHYIGLQEISLPFGFVLVLISWSHI